MANMIVDRVRRTGSSKSEFRQLIVTQGENERVLSTPIVKIKLAEDEFRFGANAVPMEQYAFQVRNTVYERFADATAAVFKIHHIEIAENELADAQIYVIKAVKILKGEEPIKILKEIPETAAPARAA